MSFELDIEDYPQLSPVRTADIPTLTDLLISFGRNFQGLDEGSEQYDVMVNPVVRSAPSHIYIRQLFTMKDYPIGQVFVSSEIKNGLLKQSVWLIFDGKLAVPMNDKLDTHVRYWAATDERMRLIDSQLTTLGYATMMMAARRADLHSRDASA